MNAEVLGFVEEWISEHIHAGDYATDADNTQAKALARQCLADATAQGISEMDIKDAIDDLGDFMAAAIEEANEREAHRLGAEEDDEEVIGDDAVEDSGGPQGPDQP